MQILLLLSSIPDSHGEAIDVVSNETVRLMGDSGNTVYVQPIIRESWSEESSKKEQHAKNYFSSYSSVIILPSIYLGNLIKPSLRISQRAIFLITILRSFPILRQVINKNLFFGMYA